MSLFSATKLIKKPEKLAKHDSPINDSEHTEHFQPSTSNDFTVGNYILKKHIADGTFGRVYEAMDQRNKSKFAIKIVKATRNCVNNAKLEASKISELHTKKASPAHRLIVNLYDHFEWKGHYCLVLERLSMNLFDFLKVRDYKGYPRHIFKEVFKQLIESVGFLHSQDLVHTDLKPENALFEKDPFTSHEFTIKLIDFGNISSISEAQKSMIITSRQYRAPETVLGCLKWGKYTDVWGLGCVGWELLTGKLLFNTKCDQEHIALMEKRIGKIPAWMIRKSRGKLRPFFKYKQLSEFKFGSLCVNKKRLNDKMMSKVKGTRNISAVFSDKQDSLLLDLMKKLLTIDPLKRISCEDALKHDYFKK